MDIPEKKAEEIHKQGLDKMKASEARYVTLSPKEFAEKKEGHMEEEQPAMEVTCGEEIMEVEHLLNEIRTDAPQADEAEQITDNGIRRY